MRAQLTGSAGRMGRMAAAGNKVAIMKLSAIIVGTVMVLYYGWKLFL
jgi:blocked-early-in-transport protein 1